MCELFGVSSSEKINLNEYLTEFFSHGKAHPDGWGMAFFHGIEVAVEKQPINSRKSMYLKSRLSVPIESDNMFAHIRLATKGTDEYENTHPFVMRDDSGRNWTLIHNGTIFDSELLDPMFYEQKGQTDSERILVYIIKQVNARLKAGEALGDADRFRLIDKIIGEITPGNKVNLAIYDGELTYVHTNYRGSLHRKKQGAAMLFSTRPLGRTEWKALPMNTLQAYHDGELVFTGTNHGNEYIDTLSKTRHLYLDYAAL